MPSYVRESLLFIHSFIRRYETKSRTEYSFIFLVYLVSLKYAMEQATSEEAKCRQLELLLCCKT